VRRSVTCDTPQRSHGLDYGYGRWPHLRHQVASSSLSTVRHQYLYVPKQKVLTDVWRTSPTMRGPHAEAKPKRADTSADTAPTTDSTGTAPIARGPLLLKRTAQAGTRTMSNMVGAAALTMSNLVGTAPTKGPRRAAQPLGPPRCDTAPIGRGLRSAPNACFELTAAGVFEHPDADTMRDSRLWPSHTRMANAPAGMRHL
jgi:hypothetical protein